MTRMTSTKMTTAVAIESDAERDDADGSLRAPVFLSRAGSPARRGASREAPAVTLPFALA